MSEQRVALVTGISSGIGPATASSLLTVGFRPFGTIANGDQRDAVASVVIKAITSRSPRLRYPGGREVRLLTMLKAFAPERVLDRGLRKQFGLTSV